MAEAKSNSSPSATPEERLERLLSACHLVRQNWDNLIAALSFVEDGIPDRDGSGLTLSSLLRLLIAHQNEEFADFASEIALAEGEAA